MSRLSSLLDVACAYRHQLGIVLLVTLALGLLNTITLVWGTPGTASHTLSIVNTILIVGFGGLVGLLYYHCGQRSTY